MQGLVTDVAVKRKIRDFVDASKGGEGNYKIYMQHRGVLNRQHQRAYDELDLDADDPSREGRERGPAVDVPEFLRHPHVRRRHVHRCERRDRCAGRCSSRSRAPLTPSCRWTYRSPAWP